MRRNYKRKKFHVSGICIFLVLIIFILTKRGNIYVGVCIDTACTLGMCAERNAIANMITNGESQIDKVVAVMPDGRVGSPCGACREYMMQLDKNSGEIEILLDLETKKTVRLKS